MLVADQEYWSTFDIVAQMTTIDRFQKIDVAHFAAYINDCGRIANVAKLGECDRNFG